MSTVSPEQIDSRASRKYATRMPPEERREQILDAVLEVISDAGITAVSVDGIARKLGFTRPVVYAHFTDANDMLRASLKREEQRALEQLVTVVPMNASGTAEDISAGFRAYLQAILDEPTRWRAILLPVGAAPALVKTVRRGRTQLAKLLAGLISARLPPHVDSELLARLCLAVGEEAGRLVLTEPEAFPIERLVGFSETLAQLVLANVGDRPS